MKAIVFDIETADVFTDEKRKAEDLELAIVAVYNYSDNSYSTYTKEELDKLWELMRNIDTLIGFNSNHFDIPLLNKYSPIDLKKEFKSIDLMENVKQSLGRRIKLDWIADGTLGINKSGDGLKAVEWWNRGEIDKVREYCIDDVKITKEIFDYAKENKKLLYNDLGTINTIQIDTTGWEDALVEDPNTKLF